MNIKTNIPWRLLMHRFFRLQSKQGRFAIAALLGITATLVASGQTPSGSQTPTDNAFNELSAKVLDDPAKIVGHEQCARCHGQEISQWQTTPHFKTFDTLHRKPEAKAIADRLGLNSVKRNDTCIKCHYTAVEKRGRLRPVSGVSCEACHGAAKDWINIHADYGGAGITKATESPEHRQARRDQAIAAGMNNPSNVYLIARQCLECHTTPEESLVNVGGHPAGSSEFELVSWSQGMVRHNFQRTGGTTNAPSALPRVRVMFVVGAMADLEASLRAVAKATSAEKFGTTVATRAARVKQKLWEIQRLINDPTLQQALDAVSKLEIRLENADAITTAADKVGAAAYQGAKLWTGNELTAIDGLIPPPTQYKY